MTHLCINSWDDLSISKQGHSMLPRARSPSLSGLYDGPWLPMHDLQQCGCRIQTLWTPTVTNVWTQGPHQHSNASLSPTSRKKWEAHGSTMNIPVKHPVQIYIFAILFQIFKKVSAQRQMMKVQKVQSPFWKLLFFASRHKAGLGLESLGCQKHINHCCIHLGSQVVS